MERPVGKPRMKAAARAPRASHKQALTSIDPVEVALGVLEDDEQADTARALLQHQIQLIDRQAEAAVLQSDLTRQDLHHRRWERINLHLTVALKVLTIGVGLAIATAFGGLAWRASQAEGLVIEAFTVPADLAQRGVTGELVAARVLDRMAELTRATDSARPASTFADDWSRNIAVEIPQTNISISDLDRSLRRLLGHETHLNGSVYRTATGLGIAARTGPGASTLVEGPESDLQGLIDQAAQALFMQTQPYRYAVSLQTQGRSPEALVLFTGLGREGSNQDRAWALLRRAAILEFQGRIDEAWPAASEASRLDPGNATAVWQLAVAEGDLGHFEASLRGLSSAVRLLERSNGRLTPAGRRQRLPLMRAQVELLRGDYVAAANHFGLVDREPPVGFLWPQGVNRAQASARAHDLAPLRALTRDIEGGVISDAWAAAFLPELRASAALEYHDWAALAAIEPRTDRPRLAYNQQLASRAGALAELGRRGEAEALLAPTRLDNVILLQTRGTLAAVAGDRPNVERWFAAATRLAPSIPDARQAWGEARLRVGDPQGSIEQFQAAARLQPRLADAYFGWGQALVRLGRPADAVPLFRRAAGLAPWWGHNQLEWGDAELRLGHRADAASHVRAAARLGVPVDQRPRLTALLAATGALVLSS